MEFTKNEIDRFLALIKSHDHNSAREFLYSDVGRIQTIDISLKNSENKDVIPDTHIAIIYRNAIFTEHIFFKDEDDAVFSDDDLEFINSIFNKKLKGFLLIYKNNLRLVYDEGVLKNEHITIAEQQSTIAEQQSFCGKLNIYINIRGRAYNMTRDDADLSDYLWGILCNDKSLMLDMLKYYMKDSECFSSNIQKRIQSYYDSLTDSEKLLLELGEEI